VKELEGTNSKTNEKYKYLSATIEAGKCYITLKKNQPLSYQFSSDPEKRKQYTYDAMIRYEEGFYATTSASAADSTDDDLPFN